MSSGRQYLHTWKGCAKPPHILRQQQPALYGRLRAAEVVGQHLRLAAAALSLWVEGPCGQDSAGRGMSRSARPSVITAQFSASGVENGSEISA